MSSEVICEDLILNLEMDEPNGELKEKAKRELRETPEIVENGLKELKKLLAGSDLIIPENDDKWLMKYLRRCKFYPESARNLIREHFLLRQKYNEITQISLPSILKAIFDANLVTIYPKRNQDGCRIVISHGGKLWNHKIIPIEYLLAGSVICGDLLQLEPATQINGVIFIFDTLGLSFGQALKCTPYVAKRALDYIQTAIPLRIKGFHVVNQPKILEPIFAAMKPFFSEKYRNRIMMHGSDFKALHKYISPDCLPECYGGTLKTRLMYGPETYSFLEQYEEHYKNLQTYGFKKGFKCII